MNTFDRHLLRRFWHVFAIGFFATYGLFVVFDVFSNADEFQNKGGDRGTVTMLTRMGHYYFFNAFPFLDLVGPTLAVLSVIAVFAMLQRSKEIYPILSAGVPTYRVAVPIMVGVMTIVLAVTVNQEIVIPRLGDRLQAARGAAQAVVQSVQTARDFVTNIEVTGSKLDITERRIEGPEFLLPVSTVVAEPVTLRGSKAIHIPAKGNRPSGWLIKDPSLTYQQLKLTENGSTLIYAKPGSSDMFIVTSVTIDQLHSSGASFKMLSTAELVQRIRNPAFGPRSIHKQSIHLHERLTRPFLILFAALISIPLTMKKESRGMIANLVMAVTVLGVVFAVGQGTLILGGMNAIPIALGAWLPLALSGTLCVLLSNRVQT